MLAPATFTRIITLNSTDLNEGIVEDISACFKEGKVVVFPTETVYGLGALYSNKEAIERIYRIKKRSDKKPLTLLIAKKEMILDFVDDVSEEVYALMDAFWPGPLTLILRNKNKEAFGFRIPAHDIALRLLESVKEPIATTSANFSGEKDITNGNEVIDTLQGKVDIIVDSGESPLKIASTVVEIRGERGYSILRAGTISEKQIKEYLGSWEK